MEEWEGNEHEGTTNKLRMAMDERDEVEERASVMRDVGATMQGEESMRGVMERLGAKMRKRGKEE